MELSRQQKESIYEYLQDFFEVTPYKECCNESVEYDEYLDAVNVVRN